MSSEFVIFIRDRLRQEPPGFMLNWTSGLMQFYPWLLRLGLVLHRLTQ
jgi:hypothetical protein